MRCTCYCTATSYDIPRLSQMLQMTGTTQLFREVIHSQTKEGTKRDVFYFPYGAVVFWGFSEEEEKELLTSLKKFEKEPLPKPEVDEFTFAYGDKMKIQEDEIVLQKKDALTKLSTSYAIAQSVKLTVFEETVSRTIEHSKQIPRNLADVGKIPLSRKETSRKMGELFMERSYINLHSEILDTPEFFWEHAELEPLYRRMFYYLDVGKRVELLNRRLALMHELYEILSNELNHEQSSRLEMTIIILIVIEVVLALLRDLFHLI
ncbi:MAG: RMD1 family protein [Verrucomicrobiota bacterium]|nr:RMD1 family protein [Verrucomicrobiota bacterium]